MLRLTRAPLFDCTTADKIYSRQGLLAEFMETFRDSGLAKMIRWAKSSPNNRILELQFQSVLVGALHEHFMTDDAAILPTQEDTVGSNLRTDIPLRGKSTILILELKHKPSAKAPPTPAKMKGHHHQLSEYVEEVSKEEEGQLVVSSIVVMARSFRLNQRHIANYAAHELERD